MEITEVRIKLMENPEDRLRGFCSVTFDGCFVIRDLKIIEGNRGPFVAMPSRKLTSNCHKCRSKNHLKAHYCNQCGTKLRGDNIEHDANGRAKLYADIAHPINAQCREAIQSRIVEELEKETLLSKEPGYRSRYDEGYDDRANLRRNEKKQSAPKPVNEDDASSKSDSAADSQAKSDSITGPQSEVETRIDIPRPQDGRFPQSIPSSKAPTTPTARPSESLASESRPSERPDPPAARPDGNDNFGKGIF
jgi:stage V sporulation protein G